MFFFGGHPRCFPGVSHPPSPIRPIHGEVAEHLRISRDGGVADRLDQLPGAGRPALRWGRPKLGDGDPAAAEAGEDFPSTGGPYSFSWPHGGFWMFLIQLHQSVSSHWIWLQPRSQGCSTCQGSLEVLLYGQLLFASVLFLCAVCCASCPSLQKEWWTYVKIIMKMDTLRPPDHIQSIFQVVRHWGVWSDQHHQTLENSLGMEFPLATGWLQPIVTAPVNKPISHDFWRLINPTSPISGSIFCIWGLNMFSCIFEFLSMFCWPFGPRIMGF